MDFKLIDKENFIFDGVLHKVDAPRRYEFVESSVQMSVDRYKREFVDAGRAFGMIDEIMEVSRNDEISEEEVKTLNQMDPILVTQTIMQSGVEAYEREQLDPSLATFQIIDILYDPIKKVIGGRIHLLDTPSGNAARERVKKNMKMYISKGVVEDVIDRNRNRQDKMVFQKKIVDIIGNWRISFLGRGGDYGF